jgi:hypothetical protein
MTVSMVAALVLFFGVAPATLVAKIIASLS